MERATMAAAFVTIDPTKAQIFGMVSASWSDTENENHWVTGVTVTISTGDQVQYMYSDMSLGAPYTQYTDPQFAILNVDPPPGGKATITFSHPDPSIVINSVTIPVRADEVTQVWQEEVSDPGELAQGVTISGTVRDVEADTLFGQGATVTLTHRDGTILGTTLTDINSEYYFEYVPSLMPVYLTGSHTGPGYIPWNTVVFNAVASSLEDPAMASESLFAQVASTLPAFNEPAWNSTLQSYAWFGFEMEDPAGDKLAGVTFTTDAPGAVIYYWDDSALTYTTNGPTSSSTNGPQVLGYAPGTSEGMWTFTLTGSHTDSVDAVLNAGEVTYWYIE